MTEGRREVLLEGDEAVLVLVRGDEEGRDVLLAEAFEVFAHLRGVNEVILVEIESDEVILVLLHLVFFGLRAPAITATTSLSSTGKEESPVRILSYYSRGQCLLTQLRISVPQSQHKFFSFPF